MTPSTHVRLLVALTLILWAAIAIIGVLDDLKHERASSTTSADAQRRDVDARAEAAS